MQEHTTLFDGSGSKKINVMKVKNFMLKEKSVTVGLWYGLWILAHNLSDNATDSMHTYDQSKNIFNLKPYQFYSAKRVNSY